MKLQLSTIATTAVALLALAACGNGDTDESSTDEHAGHATTSTEAMDHAMPGMDMGATDGLAASENGYTLELAPITDPAAPITFTITKDGTAVSEFTPEQTQDLHFYMIRSDLTGFEHVHPTMAADGTWTAPTTPHTPGAYRVYTQFTPTADEESGALVLSTPLTLPGAAAPDAPLPAPAASTSVDGYDLEVTGMLMAGGDSTLTITITKDGAPVTTIEPYLESYAHVTAIRAGDLALAHLHPNGGAVTTPGGPTLSVDAHLSEPGDYRLFIQFQTDGVLHTAPITLVAS